MNQMAVMENDCECDAETLERGQRRKLSTARQFIRIQHQRTFPEEHVDDEHPKNHSKNGSRNKTVQMVQSVLHSM
jgi:hypothetical protein